MRLEQLVAARLSQHLARSVPRSIVRRLVMSGAVRLRGLALRRPGLPVEAGWSLELVVDPTRLGPLRPDVPFVLTAGDVLFHDDAVIAVAKPAGLPTVPTADPSRPSLVRAVGKWLADRHEGEYLGVHQRLDRETSGVVLFAHDPRANAGLAQAFAGRRIEKTYTALTIRPDRPPAARFRVASPIEGRSALTEVAVLRRLGGALLVEAHPRTGRKHQVRIHLARAGLGILGDHRYGSRDARALRLMLHATRLELHHPLSGRPLSIECPLPEDFRTLLAKLI